jgi:hypothetical protein
MNLRDKIVDVIDNALYMDECGDLMGVDGLEDAIIAALPVYETQQARIAQLEAVLVNIVVEGGKCNGTKERIISLGRAALNGEST